MKFDVFAEIFADIAAFVADFYAKIKEFAAGFNKKYGFEEEE